MDRQEDISTDSSLAELAELPCCMVCLNHVLPLETERLWECTCCHKTCHMLCMFQWALRLSLNADATLSAFTCPGCRTRHSISTLPGFEQQQQQQQQQQHQQQQRVRPPTQAQPPSAATDIVRQILDMIPDGIRLQSSSRAHTASNVDDNDDDDDDDEEDDDDEDEEEGENGVANPAVPPHTYRYSVSTEKIYIDIGTLNVNISTIPPSL